jgi:uncharacterized protein (TIRG00374 family)
MRARWVRLAIWLAAIVLLWWALRAVPLAEIALVLGELAGWQVALLIIVNTAIILLFGLRWWLILRAQGYAISFVSVVRYRLAAFGVSYFTPGPHFGGEPLQVYYLGRHHSVPTAPAVAAVTLDKLIELISNFSFLVFALALVLAGGLFTGLAREQTIAVAFGMLLIPVIYLGMLWRGSHPVTGVSERLLKKAKWLAAVGVIRDSEERVGEFCRSQPLTLLTASLLSVLVWAALILEYRLALHFLGLRLAFTQIIAVMAAARISLLAPMPGALGALEAGQVLAMQALGFDAAFGAAISLLIRARDVCFGLLGLWWGGVLSGNLLKVPAQLDHPQ